MIKTWSFFRFVFLQGRKSLPPLTSLPPLKIETNGKSLEILRVFWGGVLKASFSYDQNLVPEQANFFCDEMIKYQSKNSWIIIFMNKFCYRNRQKSWSAIIFVMLYIFSGTQIEKTIKFLSFWSNIFLCDIRLWNERNRVNLKMKNDKISVEIRKKTVFFKWSNLSA